MMQTENTKIHSEIALEIKAAKKRMFQLHRAGTSMRGAADQFVVDIEDRFRNMIPSDDEVESVEVTLPNGEKVDLIGDAVDLARKRAVRVPIIGTVSAAGVDLRPEFEQEDEETRVTEEAQSVVAFLNGDSPDFLVEAVLSAIKSAFDHCGLHHPSDEHGLSDLDEENLRPLFQLTKVISWGDMYHDDQKVLDSVSQLLHNPRTPRTLYTAVADFVCEQSNEMDHHSEPVLAQILSSVHPEDWIGIKAESAEVSR